MQHKQRSKRIIQKELRKRGQTEPRSDVGVDGHYVLYCARSLKKIETLFQKVLLVTRIVVKPILNKLSQLFLQS